MLVPLSPTMLSRSYPQRDLRALHSQLPAIFLERAPLLRARQAYSSARTRLCHLFPAPRHSSYKKPRRRARRCPARWQNGGRDCPTWEHRHARVLPRPRGDSSCVRRWILPLRRFGRVAPGWICTDSRQDQRHHHLWRRGTYIISVSALSRPFSVHKCAVAARRFI